jgi:hypothetical protein
MAAGKVSLSVNDASIELNNFVEGYIDHLIGGIIASLRGTGETKSIELSVQGDQVSIVLNNAIVPLNPFVTQIIRSTIGGMVSSLKGVRTIERIKVSIKR